MNSLDDESADWNFFLGLLRAAVANHKLADGEPQSAVFHLRAALKFLAPYSDRHHDVHLAELRCGLKAQLAALLSNTSPPPPPRVTLVAR